MTREFGYTDLSHAVLGRDIGTTLLKNASSEFDSAELFALSVRGECAGGDHEHEYAALLTREAVAGVIAQLTYRLKQSGIAPDELDRLLAAESAHLADEDDTVAGILVPACDTCRRAEPECICPAAELRGVHVWAMR